jgi:uncharacterized protein (TIGR00369 family)
MTEPLTDKEIQAGLEQSPFGKFLGLKVVSTDSKRGELIMSAQMRPEFERGAGSNQWHGGPIAAIIDTVGDYALVMTLRRAVPTINFRVDYFRPAIDTALVATALVRRSGKSIGSVDIDVHDTSRNLVAVGRATYSTAAS